MKYHELRSCSVFRAVAEQILWRANAYCGQGPPFERSCPKDQWFTSVWWRCTTDLYLSVLCLMRAEVQTHELPFTKRNLYHLASATISYRSDLQVACNSSRLSCWWWLTLKTVLLNYMRTITIYLCMLRTDDTNKLFSKIMKITTEVLFILIKWIILTAQISIFHSIFHKNGRYSDKNLYAHI
jgi:hypothetical protein